MTEPKWTPGPHRVIFGAGDWGMPTSHYILRPGAKDEYDQNEPIALLQSIQPYCIGSSQKERQLAVEQRANAQLYAAAPDMYAALKIVSALQAAHPEVLAVVDAAMRKARGE